jgi:hypothetical protein
MKYWQTRITYMECANLSFVLTKTCPCVLFELKFFIFCNYQGYKCMCENAIHNYFHGSHEYKNNFKKTT